MIRVVIMGSDVRTEVSLMRRLQRIAALTAEGLSMGYQLETCDLLVIQDTPALQATRRRLAQANPDRPLWLIDAGGRLFDPARGSTPLSEDAIRDTLLALHVPAAPKPPAPAQMPVAEHLRTRLLERQGHAVLSLDGVPILQLDFSTATARPLHSARVSDNVPGLLGPALDRLVLEEGGSLEPPADAPRLPLMPLLWQTALRMRMVPRLVAPLTEATALQMTLWPDFSVLAHRHDDFQLCALLRKQACTATEAAAQVGIDAGAARAFFNAAYISGHATVADAGTLSRPSASTPMDVSPPSRLSGLWHGLRGGRRKQDR